MAWEILTGKFASFSFNLLVSEDDWSIHAFHEDRIVFLGLNSCDRNDKLWHGASFNRNTINKAIDRLKADYKDYIKIGVWHHGFTPSGYRPDYLRLNDLSALYSAGINLGFHGHIHESPEVTNKWYAKLGNTICIQPGQSSSFTYVTIDLNTMEFSRHTEA